MIVVFRRWQEWGHYRHRVRPLAAALSPVIDQPEGKPRDWLDVPSDYAEDEEAEIVIAVPQDFTGADRDMEEITRAVSVKLGLIAPEFRKELESRHPRLIYKRSIPPPLSVDLRDIRAAIDAAGDREIVLGLAKKSAVVKLNLDTETPHSACSMGTGSGKSAVAMNMGAQMLYHGAVAMILDLQMISHMWARDLPNVCYADDIEKIHLALCWLGWDERDENGTIINESEITRRRRVGLATADRGGDGQW